MFGHIFKRTFMDWNDYKKRIDLLDIFCWQQAVRREHLRNS
ncbi:MAG: hypothetical protein ABH879_02470 [archaeon]